MQKTSKISSLLLVAVLLGTTLLSACTKTDEGTTTPTAKVAATEDAKSTGTPKTAGEKALETGKYDPPITITRVVNNTQEKFVKGETYDNNVFTKWSKETLGIDIKTLWTVENVNDAYNQKLKLSLASGEALPDIVAFRDTPTNLNQLIDSQRFMAVDDLFEKYASPLWKSLAKQYPEMWYGVTQADGKKYGVPVLDYTLNAESVFWIREDWLKKLNLKAPTTLDELDAVMDAFVTKDPDGNGKADTFGLAVTLRDRLSTWMSELSWLFGAYGTNPRSWNLTPDGKLEFGSINPGSKQALGKLKEWMEKKYISPESGTWDETKASELFTSGKAGIIAGAHWMPDWPLSALKDNVPTSEYKAYSVPAGPDGKKGVSGGPINSMVNGYMLINKDSKNPEAYFLYYNYMLEKFANPAVGSEFEFGFAEGYDWKMVDGKPSRDNSAGDLVTPTRYGLNWEGARLPDLMIKTLVKVAKEAPTTPFELQTKQFRKQQEIDSAQIVLDYDTNKQRYPDYFAGSYTDSMNKKMELLRQMEVEAFTKIIYGKAPLDSFETFVSQWKSSGGDEATTDVNAWYTKVNLK